MTERHDYLMGVNLLAASEDAPSDTVKEQLAANAVPYLLKDIAETLHRMEQMEQVMAAGEPAGKS